MNEKIQTVIVGGGQAGLSLSTFLLQKKHEHIVLEKAERPGEAWRNGRWDSFTLVTPNWSFRLPGAEYHGEDPGGFLPKDEIVHIFENYQRERRHPVQFNTTVTGVDPESRGGFSIRAQAQGSEVHFRTKNVVIATGLFQTPKLPEFAAAIPPTVAQLHSSQYRNPQSIPPGAVLVVGAGQSGGQIAEELLESGRQVYLSAGFAPMVPRRYRGRDAYEWAEATGFLSRTPDKLPSMEMRFSSNPLLSGKNGGHSLNLHQFFHDGMILLGRLVGFEENKFSFAADLHQNLARSDKAGADFCAMVDRYILQAGLDAPEENIVPRRDGYQAPLIESLDIHKSGVSAVVWANGYSFDYSLVHLPVTDRAGFPVTQRGQTRFPGLFFLGMSWLHTQKSGLLLGVGEDAAYLAERL